MSSVKKKAPKVVRTAVKESITERSLTYKPFKYPWAIALAQQHEDIHWTENEAELSEDIVQWNTGVVTPVEKNHITQILRLFTQTDVEVAGNYVKFFLPNVQNNEIRSMLLAFAAREGIHQRAYALLNDTLGLPDSEYSAFLEYKEMVDKLEFMDAAEKGKMLFTSNNAIIAEKAAQAVCNEGMSLFSEFVMLLNYQRFGKMRGMCTIVEWSLRDEDAHADGMAKLFQQCCIDEPEIVTDELKAKIYTYFATAVELEDKVIDLAFAMGDVPGLTASEVKAYIRYMADKRLIQLGLKAIHNQTENPLLWVDWVVNGDSFKNFFEGRVADYSADALSGEWGWDHT
jgi:ribonucleoside-diphosphate reductase beta chain